MEIEATAVIEAMADEIKTLTQRAIIAEAQVRALLKKVNAESEPGNE